MQCDLRPLDSKASELENSVQRFGHGMVGEILKQPDIGREGSVSGGKILAFQKLRTWRRQRGASAKERNVNDFASIRRGDRVALGTGRRSLPGNRILFDMSVRPIQGKLLLFKGNYFCRWQLLWHPAIETAKFTRKVLAPSDASGYTRLTNDPRWTMPYEAFEKNKKIKAQGSLSALDQAVRELQSPGLGLQPKTLERHRHAVRFVRQSLRSGSFSADETARLERTLRIKDSRTALGKASAR
jgi:hypothetical protein